MRSSAYEGCQLERASPPEFSFFLKASRLFPFRFPSEVCRRGCARPPARAARARTRCIRWRVVTTSSARPSPPAASRARTPAAARVRGSRRCYAPLAFETAQRYFLTMTDKQAVIDALNRLPEVASLEEITEELHIMASIRRGRADIAAGRSKPHEQVEQLVDSWATAWTSR